ncbi:serine/threonine-protein phosphatase 2A regulatory subunit B' [Tieghemostelium lacteum]|uniref:Serine/threonine-protein phosphatase 2A activator n=1 Tax=Tieghemostelium lacteum TaxID=361077 RepID=A0A151ZKF0_TIELA|nr:serine/threonine-protein phosphatase 2A regulatory subunit B' [Tieghemostelium lacteum]|eukprot:KYQ94294.1 serine/threonine-protein phosphatase 2A regulatory subunit B' [Tieghemostelium lacteum]
MANNINNNNQVIPKLIDINTHQFVEPRKVITNQNELNQFLMTQTCKDFLVFIQRVGDEIVSKSNSADVLVSPVTSGILAAITEMSNWIDGIPPLAQPMRYGNKAYRIWHAKLLENIKSLHESFLPQPMHKSIIELSPYLIDAMGNQTRLDYGTGHELHFVAWLYCLRSIGALEASDEPAMVLKIFTSYLNLVRKLQTVYGLEPAGTHGVWSLDDYQFIPFIWGGAQLVNHPLIKPSSILDEKIVNQYYQDYMYLSCIKYIMNVKKGPFHEHSRDLFNISGAANWDKIHKGMFKKFFDEVMTKTPIIQHFLFGSLIVFSLDG